MRLHGSYSLRVAIIGLIAVLSACAPADSDQEESSPTSATIDDIVAQLDGLEGPEREETLLEMVESEGSELSLYTSLSSEVEDELADAFGDAYDIDVSVFRADSETMLQRLREESRADFTGADVVETTGFEMVLLDRDGILARYESPSLELLSEDAQQGSWTTDRFNNFVVSWNTSDVSPSERPRSWEDLADPRWEGRLAMEPSDVPWFKALWEHWEDEGRSSEEIQDLFEGMAKNSLFIKGHTTTGTLLTAGEVSVAASNYSYLVEAEVAKGAPVEWKPIIEPVISLPFGVAPAHSAPHPATALLFVDWLLSDGQEVLLDLRLDPAREDLSTTAEVEERVVDLTSLVDDQEEWTQRYEELTRLGEVGN